SPWVRPNAEAKAMARAATANPVIRLLTVIVVSSAKPTTKGEIAKKTPASMVSPWMNWVARDSAARSYGIRIATMSGCCSIGRVGVAMTNLPIDVLPPPELPRSRAINQRRGVPYATRKTPAPRASTAALTRHGLGRGLCQRRRLHLHCHLLQGPLQSLEPQQGRPANERQANRGALLKVGFQPGRPARDSRS